MIWCQSIGDGKMASIYLLDNFFERSRKFGCWSWYWRLPWVPSTFNIKYLNVPESKFLPLMLQKYCYLPTKLVKILFSLEIVQKKTRSKSNSAAISGFLCKKYYKRIISPLEGAENAYQSTRPVVFDVQWWQPIARTIWRAHHHHDSQLPQPEEYPITLYVCMYVCMYVCTYVWIYDCLYVCILYVTVFEGMYVLPCADDVQLGLSEGLGQPTNDWSQWAGKTLPCLHPNPLLLLLSSR